SCLGHAASVRSQWPCHDPVSRLLVRCWRLVVPQFGPSALASLRAARRGTLLDNPARTVFCWLRAVGDLREPRLVLAIITAVKFMAMAFGPAGAKAAIWTAFALAMAVLSLATITLLVLELRRNPLEERVRIAGLLLFAFGFITLIAGIGKERAGWVP